MRMLRVLPLIAVPLAAGAPADGKTTDGSLASVVQASPQAQQVLAQAPARKADPPMTQMRAA